MIIRFILAVFIAITAAVCPHNFAADSTEQNSSIEVPFDAIEPVSVKLASEFSSIQPGAPFWVAIEMSIDKQWHAYWKNPGDAGMAPSVSWNLPEGFEVGPLQWPVPKRFNLDSSVGLGYEDKVVFLAQVTPPSSLQAMDAPIELSADIRWVVCSDSTCLPGEEHISLQLPIRSEMSSLVKSSQDFFSQARACLPKPCEGVSAERAEHAIQLTFHDISADQEAVKSVQFFPEQKAIDHKNDPQLRLDQHRLILTEKDSEDKISSLKGVLVLQTDDAEEAYNIDVPISPSNEDISMNPIVDRQLEGENLGSLPSDSFEFEGGFFLALAFAFIGGVILNCMPCVLPVISLKIISFVKLAGESRRLIFHHGLAFSAGVLLSFWVLAAVLLALQAYGRAVGWGFQLQEPLFVAILASLLFVFALSLFGLFEIGTSLISAAGQAEASSRNKNALFRSFLSGVLATAVATPCTGPFLGSAVGFAVTLSPPLSLLIFTSLGLGMSAPYLILAAFPSLLRFMPKAGAWMNVFKELMGFFMLATVLWLVWVFGAQTNSLAVTVLLGGFFFMALACWIYGRWTTLGSKKLTRMLGMIATVALFLIGSYAVVLSSSSWVEAVGEETVGKAIDQGWEEFSPERVADLRKQGIPVFIDFTAKWCLICQTNHLVLCSTEVSQKFAERGVVLMKADWTKNDPEISAELRKFGRNSVPLYVLYNNDTDASTKILPQVLTPKTVMEFLEK